MLKKWIKPLGTLAGMSVLVSGAFAQEATDQKPADPKKPATDAQQAATPAAPAADAQAETPEVVKTNSVTFFGSTWNSSGSANRFASNGFIPSGLGLADLSILHPYDGKSYMKFNWSGQPEQDEYARFFGVFPGITLVRLGYSLNHYFEPTWQPSPLSGDTNYSGSLEHQFRPNIGAYVSFSSSDQSRGLGAPYPVNQTQTRNYMFGFEGNVLSGQGGLTYSEQRTSNLSGLEPLTMVDRTEGHYGKDIGQNVSLEGIASYSRIQQQGLNNSSVRAYALRGVWSLDDNTMIQAGVSRQDLTLPNVQNAYVKNRYQTDLQFNRRMDRWGLKLGVQHKEEDRVTADHSYTDVPKWNIATANLTGRIGESMRVTFKGSWQNLTNAATYMTDDPTQLAWDDQANTLAKIEGGNDDFSWYASYSYKFRNNVARQVLINWHTFTVGASHVFSPKVQGYIELSRDNIHASGVISATDNLAAYFPNSQSASLGMDWTLTPTETFSASYNYFESADLMGSQLALHYNRQLPRDRTFEVMVAPWLFDDKRFGLTGYNYTLLMVKYGAKF